MVVTTGRFQPSPRKDTLKIRALQWNGCQEVVGSLSGLVLNQRTDDHILEMFSVGLMSWESWNPMQHRFSFHERHVEALGEGLGALRLCFYFRSSGKCSGSVTGRNVWVAFQDMSKQVYVVELS